MERYNEEMQQQYEILDAYDFLPYLKIYQDIDELMFNFEYECDIGNLPPEFENCVFNFISHEEFVDYLRKRYPNYRFNEAIRWSISPVLDTE